MSATSLWRCVAGPSLLRSTARRAGCTSTSAAYLGQRVTRLATPRLNARSFVSLNDLARLTPFGGAGETKKEDSVQGSGIDGDAYTETVTLPYSKAHLFNIVSDVASYEQFVPYCLESRILPSADGKRKEDEFLAELTVGFGSLRERYTSTVKLVGRDKVIAKAIPTPLFQVLETSWSLSEASKDHTRVDFAVRYAFSNPLYAAMAKAAMHKMVSQMVGAFEQRAKELA